MDWTYNNAYATAIMRQWLEIKTLEHQERLKALGVTMSYQYSQEYLDKQDAVQAELDKKRQDAMRSTYDVMPTKEEIARAEERNRQLLIEVLDADKREKNYQISGKIEDFLSDRQKSNGQGTREQAYQMACLKAQGGHYAVASSTPQSELARNKIIMEIKNRL